MGNLTDDRFLLVTLQKERYGIELLKVKEVIAPSDTTPIPFSPKHFKGLLNLRGELIPIVDLRLKMNLQTKGQSQEEAVVIIDLDSTVVGVIVDSVDSVETIIESQLSQAPEMEKSINLDFVKCVAKKKDELILILNLDNLLDSERKIIKQAA